MEAPIKNTNCPNCNHRLNAASNLEAGAGSGPKEGQYTICVYCKSVMVFNTDLSLRILSEEDIENFDDGTLLVMQRTMKRVEHWQEAEEIGHSIHAICQTTDIMPMTNEKPETLVKVLHLIIKSKRPIEVIDCVLYEYAISRDIDMALAFAISQCDL
jgi:RNase P subunit RPR2